MVKNIILILSSLLFLSACTAEEKEEIKEVNIYTHRHYDIDQKIYNDFEKSYGIKVNVLKSSADELINKIALEGENTNADLLITVDASRLNRAKDRGLLQTITDENVLGNVPAVFTSSDKSWVGLTYRGRVIAYNPDKVSKDSLKDYAGLVDDQWKGKLLMRSSKNVYNQTLVSSIIHHKGSEEALNWSKGIVENLSRTPKGNDRDQMKAMVNGEGDITVVNTYYLGLLLNSKDPYEVEVGKKVALFFPNQSTTGTHINISGAGIVKYSKNIENANLLLEYLTSIKVQEQYAAVNFEYPVNPDAEISKVLKSWGEFRADLSSVDSVSSHSKEAVLVMNKANWK